MVVFLFFSLSMISEDDDETRAQELIERGQIDQALEIYLRWRPQSARVLNTIAVIYAEKKGDYESAIEYFKKALTLQEAVGFGLKLIRTMCSFLS